MFRRDKKVRPIRLQDNETFEEYIKKLERDPIYGKDLRGTVRLIPQKPFHYAWRFETKPKEDWSPFRKTGLGWKIAYPILYGIYDSPELFLITFWNDLWLYLFFTILTIFLTLLIGYSITRLDEFLRPYGKKKDKIMQLFTDKLEFVKFSVRYYEKTYSAWWIYFGLIGFVAKLIFDIVGMFNLSFYYSLLLAPLPGWTMVFNLLRNLGIDLIIFQLITFFGAIIYGLFHLGALGHDRDNLSIVQYKRMLTSIIDNVIEAFNYQQQIDSINPARDSVKQNVKYEGKTFFEFQRANRMIGEFLFNISISMVIFFIIFQLSMGALFIFNIVISPLTAFYFNILTILSICLTFASVFMFILPQLYIHKVLKNFKNDLIDTYYNLSSRLEYLYYASLLNKDILSNKKEWESRRFILDDLSRIEKNIENVKLYSTWSYDFPHKIKKSLFVYLSPLLSLSIYFLRFYLQMSG